MKISRYWASCTVLGITLATMASAVQPDPSPEALKPPGATMLALAAHGAGVQIYACQATKDAPERFSWTLLAPEARLTDQGGKSVGRHSAGPTWESDDGSQVVGELVAREDSPDATAIPWLLLRAKSTAGHGVFSAVTWIQRLHTVGGKAPASGCNAAAAGQQSRVNYSADYNFYASPATASVSPLGIWKTVDDKTGAARALVRLYEQDGKLFGRIEHSFTPGAEGRVCAVCSDERKNQPIIGLIIIRNMRADGSDYSGGDILDPESGSVYHCKFHLEDAGTRLVVRGYIGFSLLGRSQTWQRQS